MRSFRSALVVAALACSLSSAVQADDRHFAFSYEATTMPKGTWEFEPWVTLKHYGDKDVYQFRYELEYGVTDNFQIAAYLSDWTYTDAKGVDSKAEWNTAGIEAVYALTNPNTSWIGSALYGEVLIGPEKFALEGKLLLQKNFGPFSLVYNAIMEAEWEGESYDERVGVWENTVGLCYNFSPSLSLGVEAVHEIEFEDWSEAGDHIFSVGPNVSFHTKRFYVAAAALFPANGVEGEPDVEARLVVGIKF